MLPSELSKGGVNDEFGAISSPIGEVLRTLMKFYEAHPHIERRIRLQHNRNSAITAGKLCVDDGYAGKANAQKVGIMPE